MILPKVSRDAAVGVADLAVQVEAGGIQQQHVALVGGRHACPRCRAGRCPRRSGRSPRAVIVSSIVSAISPRASSQDRRFHLPEPRSPTRFSGMAHARRVVHALAEAGALLAAAGVGVRDVGVGLRVVGDLLLAPDHPVLDVDVPGAVGLVPAVHEVAGAHDLVPAPALAVDVAPVVIGGAASGAAPPSAGPAGSAASRAQEVQPESEPGAPTAPAAPAIRNVRRLTRALRFSSSSIRSSPDPGRIRRTSPSTCRRSAGPSAPTSRPRGSSPSRP